MSSPAIQEKQTKDLPTTIINIIFQYRSELKDSKWIPYIKEENKKESIKFRLNPHSTWYKNNLERIWIFKQNNRPFYKDLFITYTELSNGPVTENEGAIITRAKITTYYSNKSIEKKHMEFILPPTNTQGYILCTYGIQGYRKRFIDGFSIINHSPELINRTPHHKDPTREIAWIDQSNSALYNRIDIGIIQDQPYLSTFNNISTS